MWSHKPGTTVATNRDGSKFLIHNPAEAHHYYPSNNYLDGGMLFWKKRD